MDTKETLLPEAEALYEKAMQIVKSDRMVSTTLLQRRLGISFPLGARIMDLLELRGVIGPQIGTKPRAILIEVTNENKRQPITTQTEIKPGMLFKNQNGDIILCGHFDSYNRFKLPGMNESPSALCLMTRFFFQWKRADEEFLSTLRK